MNRLKGVRVRRISPDEVEVLPLYYAKKGATMKGTGMRQVGESVEEAMTLLVPVLVGRRDLKE